MIFLLDNGRYKMLDRYVDEHKVVAKYQKWKDHVVAVLVECSTRLHSDMYTLVTKEHFKTKIEPLTITYTLSLYTPETPMDQERFLTRQLKVKTIGDFYNATSLIYQMQKSDDIGDTLSLGDTRVIMVGLTIEKKGEGKVEWDPSQNIVDFVAQFDMVCDTDIFLQAMGSKETMIEDGCYITRYNPHDHTHNLSYYYHEKKHLLRLCEGSWGTALDRWVGKNETDTKAAYGFCLNNTGLLYLAYGPVALSLLDAQSLVIQVTRGTWRQHQNQWYPIKEAAIQEYEGYNLADILYMGLYLPQIWDINRLITGDTPVEVACEFLYHKVFQRAGRYEVPHSKDNEGLQIDLFSLFAWVASQDLRSIYLENY
jgi:hypothetical protein